MGHEADMCSGAVVPHRLLGHDILGFLPHFLFNNLPPHPALNAKLSSMCQEKEQIFKNLP